MGERKSEILQVAKKLFNERGYQQVTIRTIAQELGMSSGNLNYHFDKRETIFEALYFEMVSVFDKRVADLPKIDVSILQIRNDISSSMRRMTDYKFFWTDLYNLLSISSKVNTHFQEVYQLRINGCCLLFDKMNSEGLMRSHHFKSEYELLAQRMVNQGNTWLYSSGLYSKNISKKHIEKQVNSLLSLLYPYLTLKGEIEFRSVVPELFE